MSISSLGLLLRPLALLISFTLALAPVAATAAQAGLSKSPHRPPSHKPPHFGYDRHHLPDLVRYEVVRGISYAIIDGFYYQQSGNSYLFVPPPHPDNKIVINTGGFGKNSSAGNSASALGKVVAELPPQHQQVVIDGVEFAVAAGVWYAAITGSDRYVIIPAQL
ncbi:DUF6515 family protein [Ferrimonas lipolytica]|uniref:Uncharacterized protein n=1 Tax=Ferrimonas lipolytica TaxID=2724191 RepID=A0A6H1UJH4_9GAMM|nr:DUF6515 family protein [Ferrimonas lipolytica]QIZ77952.1 hypothetical protein HER31_14240 [Ferrimonas lipolytica]